MSGSYGTTALMVTWFCTFPPPNPPALNASNQKQLVLQYLSQKDGRERVKEKMTHRLEINYFQDCVWQISES